MSRRAGALSLVLIGGAVASAYLFGWRSGDLAPVSGNTLFAAVVLLTLAVAVWASRRSRSAIEFYAAGGGVSAWQNGLALAGAYISVASFLGITGLIYLSGFDGVVYAVGSVAPWPIITILLAEPLRNLGQFTLADAVAFRFEGAPIRIVTAGGTLATVTFYLTAQLVGAGALLQQIYSLDYRIAVVLVMVLAMTYIILGGMLATTWIQIIKACLLFTTATLMAMLTLSRFGFDFEALAAQAASLHPKPLAILEASAARDPISTLSLGLALVFGVAGLPHVLMRFFSVVDARAARMSSFYATGLVCFFYLLIFVIGYGAVALTPPSEGIAADLRQDPISLGGANMAAVWLAHALGGDLFVGFVAAVAFATILAIIAGLLLAGASAVSHDLYGSVIGHGRVSEAREVAASRAATVVLGVIAMVSAFAFKGRNVAFLIGLAFSIAASCNFPMLAMSIIWRGATTKGLVAGGALGLVTSLVGVLCSPEVWAAVTGGSAASAPWPYANPTLFSMTLAFGAIVAISKLDASHRAITDKSGFEPQFVRSQTGIGSSGPVSL